MCVVEEDGSAVGSKDDGHLARRFGLALVLGRHGSSLSARTRDHRQWQGPERAQHVSSLHSLRNPADLSTRFGKTRAAVSADSSREPERSDEGRSVVDGLGETESFGSPHGRSFQGDDVGVMHESVADCIG